jgi:hypothetical protein
MNIKIGISFCLLLLIGCTMKKSNINKFGKTTLVFTNGCKYKVPDEKGFYFKAVIKSNTNAYLEFYNSDIFTLVLINTKDSSRTVFDLKKLLSDSVLAKNNLNDICIISPDSIFLLLNQNLIGITNTSIFINQSINYSPTDKWPHRTINEFLGVSHILYDNKNKVVYLRITASDKYRYTKDYFSDIILAAFSLKNHSISYLPIKYPSYYLDNYVGDLESFHLEQDNSKIMLTFLASTDYYKYDYSAKKLESGKLPESVFDTIPPKWFEWGQQVPIKLRMDNIVENRIYDNFIVLPNEKGYLRFFRSAIPLQNADSTYNNKFDKKISMLYISKNMELINEFKFNPKEYHEPYSSFLAKKQLFINNTYKDSNEKNYIHFLNIRNYP